MKGVFTDAVGDVSGQALPLPVYLRDGFGLGAQTRNLTEGEVEGVASRSTSG